VLRPCPGPRWGTEQVGKPCLPTKAPQPRTGDTWLIKHDGFRVIARKDGRRVRLYSRPGIASR
jgi:ATP-dependent DNA ligase